MWDLIVSDPDHCLSLYFTLCGSTGDSLGGLAWFKYTCTFWDHSSAAVLFAPIILTDIQNHCRVSYYIYYYT